MLMSIVKVRNWDLCLGKLVRKNLGWKRKELLMFQFSILAGFLQWESVQTSEKQMYELLLLDLTEQETNFIHV